MILSKRSFIVLLFVFGSVAMAEKKDQLKQYKEKRTFSKTPEPEGNKPTKSSKKPIFVIQKHDATSLHYDFRLEIDGVLKSWAVPKGPSTDPEVKHLAVETEDHPMEYANFEGVIPKGEYGAGPVMIWDYGTYKNLRDDVNMSESYKDGKIEVWLDGKKLQGGYVLIQTKMGGKKKNWLLKKIDDDKADARRNPVSSEPNSAKTGRSLKEIKAACSK